MQTPLLLIYISASTTSNTISTTTFCSFTTTISPTITTTSSSFSWSSSFSSAAAMMGEACPASAGTAAAAATAETAQQQQQANPRPEQDGVGASEEVENWYKDSGDVDHYHRSFLVNADGLKLATYRWDRQEKDKPLQGKIVLVHGYAVHARFEYLHHDLEHPEAPPHYTKSWIQRLSAAGFSVHALDQQSFGASEGLKGKRAHIQDFDALPRDIIQFMHEQVLAADPPTAPIYLCGISMGGCAVARAVELLAGGHTRNKCCSSSHSTSVAAAQAEEADKTAAPGTAGAEGGGGVSLEQQKKKEEEEKKKKHECEQQQEGRGEGEHHEVKKVLLPLRGLICLAPMFSLDRMKKKNRLLLPFAKMLATLSPTLEVAKAAKNPMYPAFDTLMKNDPLCYNGKSRARLSYELLYATSAVQQQAHYLGYPDAAAITPQSPQPYPVYIQQAPALLIVESKNDTFVDPEGSVYVAAVLHAKMEASTETLEKYMPYYEEVKATTSPDEGQIDATLWMLDDLWHCFTKELPESDALLDRIINKWLLPHAATAAIMEQKKNEKLAAAGAPAAAAVKHEEKPKEAAVPVETTGACEADKKTSSASAPAATAPAATAAAPAAAPAAAAELAGASGVAASEGDEKAKCPITEGDATGENAVKTGYAEACSQDRDKNKGCSPAAASCQEEGDKAAEKQKTGEQDNVQDAAAEEEKGRKTEEQQESSACPVAAGVDDSSAAANEVSGGATATEEEAAGGSAQQPQKEEKEQEPAATEGSQDEQQQVQEVQQTSETSAQPDAGTTEPAAVEENNEESQHQPQEEKTEAAGSQDEQPAKVEGEAAAEVVEAHTFLQIPEDRGDTQDF